MMRPPKVSVVIPAHNSARTLSQTLDSVLNQTFYDLEVLVVDDGSSDETLQTAHNWQARDPARVQVLQHPGGQNHGVAASRNLAVDRAQGEFIAFLDADDAWLPHKLETQLHAFETAGPHVGVVFSDAWNSPAEPGTNWDTAKSWRHPLSSQLGELFRGDLGSTAEHLLFSPETEFHNWVMSPTPLVRVACFRDGLRFIGPPRLNTQFEDYLMWLMLSLQWEFVAVPEPLAHYRIHQSQFVSRYCSSARCLHYLTATRELLLILKEDCREEIERRGWADRIADRFRAVSLRLLKTYSRSSTTTIRSVPLQDYAGLLKLAAQTGTVRATSLALAARSWSALSGGLSRNSLSRVMRRVIGRSTVG